ncbi:MAG: hypothetical protein WAP03_30285 [Methylorubrum rhodinum]|uniref:hypothetical protein n=1 Tax=Methylorubrum rhodinum TaxID=29428 RepID=UPI003BAFBE7F
MADDTSAPPAARALCATQPAGRSSAVTGAGQKKQVRPVATTAPGRQICVQNLAISAKPLPLGRKRAPASSLRDLPVVDDLPRPVTVSRAELDVLEAYLGRDLDAILRAMNP